MTALAPNRIGTLVDGTWDSWIFAASACCSTNCWNPGSASSAGSTSERSANCCVSHCAIRRSQSAPPSFRSPSTTTVSMLFAPIRSTEVSNVPPPRSKTSNVSVELPGAHP